jgi:hypothetical protein
MQDYGLRGCALVGALVLAACSARAGDSPSDAVAGFAKARCAAFQRCDCVSESQIADCVATTRDFVDELLELYTGPIDLGCLREAEKSWEDAPCNANEFPPGFESCRVADYNEIGEPCTVESIGIMLFEHPPQCAPGLYCDGEQCLPARFAAEGEACTADVECMSTMVCVDGRCSTQRADFGEPCVSDQHCDSPLAFCDDGVCAPTLEMGEPCDNSFACGPFYFCVDGVCDLPNLRTCQPWND